MSWPNVIGEEFTLKFLLEGHSIARFGDGEFNLCLGGNCITQPYDRNISQILRKILKKPGKCLVGIPSQNAGPKKEFWRKYDRKEVHELFDLNHHYVSSIITRPDSAPWIDRKDYWEKIRDLWRGKDVTLVRGSEKSLTKEMLWDAKSVFEIVVNSRDAFRNYRSILDQTYWRDTAILCLGPTATAMAVELCDRGVQALDLGHIGMFLRKHEQGLPMIVTQQDKAYDRK